MTNILTTEPLYIDTASTTVPIIESGILASVQRIGILASADGQRFTLREGSGTGNIVFDFISNSGERNGEFVSPIRTTRGLFVSELTAGLTARLYMHNGAI